MRARSASVIICTHNRADLLPRLIGQLRAQDYPCDAFEIIVVDNCSTDHTAQVVRRCAAEPGAPVKYVAESHLGITLARNRGAEAAKYPYLAYLDDDCTVGPDWLAHLVQGFDLSELVEVVGGRVELDWDSNPLPSWFGPELGHWLAVCHSPGDQARLLDFEPRVVECNMAIARSAWQARGRFLGMEQFGSQNMAAGEVLHLLKQIIRSGGKIAYAPQAIAFHHIGIRTWSWMLRRAYWQGVSDCILDYLITRRSWLSEAYLLVLDVAAMIVLFGYAGFYYLKGDRARGRFHLMRTIRRISLVLTRMRLAGDWPRIREWISTNHPSR